MALNHTFTLNTKAVIPAVGFGTWQAPPGQVETAVETALRAGYRHLDCAAIYRNEKEVGLGIQKSGVKREEIFITGKLWNTAHRPEYVEAALDKTLQDLGVDYVDLYLMHWPCAFKPGTKFFPLDSNGVFELDDVDPSVTWKAMEALLATGKTRAIGVSNFNIRRLESLLSSAQIVPAVNQIEIHPYLQQPDLAKFCKEKGILLEAYSPLGNNQKGEPRVIDDSKVKDIAEKLGIDPGQVLVSWGVQRGHVVLPKSVTESRIISNSKLSLIPDEQMHNLNALEKHKRYNFPVHWGFDIFDEAGAEAVSKAAQDAAESNKTKFVV